jgi:nitrate/nitrite transport system permease protein
MVSAVFHSPRTPRCACAEPAAHPRPSAAGARRRPPADRRCARPARDPFDWRGLAGTVLPPVLGLALLVGIWALLTQRAAASPRRATFDAAVKLFADPFYRNGPNDQGIGWNMLFAAARGLGFGWRRWWAFRWAS